MDKRNHNNENKPTHKNLKKRNPNSQNNQNIPQSDMRHTPPQQRSQKNAKRKRRKKNYSIYYIFFGIVILVVVFVLANTVLFNITEIVVEGESAYTSEKIIEASGLNEAKNLLHINAEEASKK